MNTCMPRNTIVRILVPPILRHFLQFIIMYTYSFAYYIYFYPSQISASCKLKKIYHYHLFTKKMFINTPYTFTNHMQNAYNYIQLSPKQLILIVTGVPVSWLASSVHAMQLTGGTDETFSRRVARSDNVCMTSAPQQ